MHQHPRSSPKPAQPANTRRTDLARPGDAREQDGGDSRTSDRVPSNEQEFNMGGGSDAIMQGQESASHGKEQLAKLSQVIQVCCWTFCYALTQYDAYPSWQNYFTKAALIILHSRVALPPAFSKDSRTRRVNKWVGHAG